MGYTIWFNNPPYPENSTFKRYTINGHFIDWEDEGEPTEEWLNEYFSDIKKEDCKRIAKELLIKSDWVDLRSMTDNVENIQEWDSYRAIIRNLYLNPIEEPTFPEEPITIWINTNNGEA